MAREFKLLFVLWLVAASFGCAALATDTTSSAPSAGTTAAALSTSVPSSSAGGTTGATPNTATSPPTAGGTTGATPNTATSPPTAGGTTGATPNTATSPPTAGGTTGATPNTATSPPTAGGTTGATPNTATSPPTAGGTTGATPNTATSPPTAGGTTGATPNTATSPPTAGGTTGATPNTPTPSPTAGGTAGATATSEAPSEITTQPQPSSDPCASNPCGRGSTCEARFNAAFVCLCLAGEFYSNDSKSCERAKVFPGQLRAPNITYMATMKDKTSKDFLKAAEIINEELKDAFPSPDYSGSTVLEIQEYISPGRVWSRSRNGIDATVEMFFKASADITEAGVAEGLQNASSCQNCSLSGAIFTKSSLCAGKPCDAETTTCDGKDGAYNCTCLDGYIKTSLSDRMCIACPSGKKVSEDKTKCESCSFGYSGFNCQESWKLTVVIVSSVLGGLLLITLIVLPFVARKSAKKSSKKSKNADIGEPFVSPFPAKAPLVNSSLANTQAASANGSAKAFTSVVMPRIPRAATNSSWDRTNLEMTPSNSRQNLVPSGRNSRLYEDQDDMAPYAQSGNQSSLYGQARPMNNPYTQSRPQVNPYASSQGHSNPYYMHDNGRRFN